MDTEKNSFAGTTPRVGVGWETCVYPAPIVPKLTIKSTYKIKNLV